MSVRRLTWCRLHSSFPLPSWTCLPHRFTCIHNLLPGGLEALVGNRSGRRVVGLQSWARFPWDPCAGLKCTFGHWAPASAELFQAPVLRVMGRVEARGAAFGGVVLRCETRLHPQKRDTPLQFAFYKYSRPVRRYDWDAEYTVPEPEVEELESYWCEAATATRSVRKRSPWLQLPGRGE